MRNDSLFSNIVFKKELFSENIRRLQLPILKSHLKQKEITSAFFSVIFFLQLRNNWANNHILCICWASPSENTGLWHFQTCPVPLMLLASRVYFTVNQLKNDTSSSVFKLNRFLRFWIIPFSVHHAIPKSIFSDAPILETDSCIIRAPCNDVITTASFHPMWYASYFLYDGSDVTGHLNALEGAGV